MKKKKKSHQPPHWSEPSRLLLWVWTTQVNYPVLTEKLPYVVGVWLGNGSEEPITSSLSLGFPVRGPFNYSQ